MLGSVSVCVIGIRHINPKKYETLAEGSVFMDHTVQDARQFFDSWPGYISAV